MTSLTELPLKTGEPEFSLAWLVIVALLLIVLVVVKWREPLLQMLSTSKRKHKTECELERVSVLADAKVMRVKYKDKETLIYSDQNGVVQLNLALTNGQKEVARSNEIDSSETYTSDEDFRDNERNAKNFSETTEFSEKEVGKPKQ